MFESKTQPVAEANGAVPAGANGSAAVVAPPISTRRVQPGDSNALNDLGEKIFLDRYALKDMDKAGLAVGDLVVVCVNTDTGQREIGIVAEVAADAVAVRLGDGEVVTRAKEHVDRPVEIHPDQMQARVARGIAAVEPEDRRALWEARFRWLLDGWKFVPGGRILAAAGTDQDLTYYNCYVIDSPHDSRDGIIRTLSQMTEIMSRGGGVGINLSSLRPRYATVRGVNGRSSGAVSWGSLYSFVTGLIEQGGSRRGALMLILAVWHPDVREFITAKRVMGRITNANISVAITDDFMAAVEADADWELAFPDTADPHYEAEWAGDLAAWRAAGHPVIAHKTVKARELWQAIIESAWASAEPGLWFSERSNRLSNSHYYAPLICTNPCVTGDTLIFTADGLVRARAQFDSDQDVDVITDGRFGQSASGSPASRVFRTGRKPVFRLQTREGYFIRATADHRVMTPQGWIELRDLRPGDRVHILSRPGGFGAAGSLELGHALGWLIGDGTIRQDRAVLSFFGREKAALAPPLAQEVQGLVEPLSRIRRDSVGVTHVRGRDEARGASTRLRRLVEGYGLSEAKHRVPDAVFVGTADMQRGFLQALFTAGGSFRDGGLKGGSLRLASSHVELLEGVQLLLLNLGIASRIYRDHRAAGYRDLPDGRGGWQADWCKAQHELVISRGHLDRFADSIGFLLDSEPDALSDSIGRGPRGTHDEHFEATVESVTPDGVEEVFDLIEPQTHSFVGNGLVLHNCGEQPLPGNAVCNLGALNLGRFVRDGQVDWESLGTAVCTAVRFLDDVIDATPYFFEENRRQQLAERRVGLGTMGLAEMMIRCGRRYGSPEGNAFLDELYRFIAVQAYLASADFAAEKGAFPQFDAVRFVESGFMRGMPEEVRLAVAAKGIRNVTLLTQAPTGTTGTMVATSTGIEPFFSWTYLRKSRLGLHEERVQVVEEWQAAHPGEPLPDTFVTAMDLTPEDHVGVQAAIQRWVDSSISKTCNVPSDYTVDQTRALYETMYRLGCKGGTVYRDSSRDEQVLMLKESAAVAKEPTPAAVERTIKPRPRQMLGTTYRVVSPVGKVYVTVNRNPEGEPFEVFVNVGKAGSDLAADAEAIGRLISLVQRLPSPLSPEERLLKVVEELDGIGGSRTVGFGAERVRSLPDGVAQALHEDQSGTQPVEPAEQLVLVPNADLCPMCGHASFVHTEGCQKCYSCGHSEC